MLDYKLHTGLEVSGRSQLNVACVVNHSQKRMTFIYIPGMQPHGWSCPFVISPSTHKCKQVEYTHQERATERKANESATARASATETGKENSLIQ